jgi:glucose-6-phosphate 1-epimerase
MASVIERVSYKGLDAVKVQDDQSSFIVTLFGAHVCSWEVAGEEQLFVSSLAKFDKSKAIRGGIPIVFPQFGRPNEVMAQHGFARNCDWTVASQSIKEKSITLELRESDETKVVWPHEFCVTLEISLLGGGTLGLEMNVQNTGATAFECHTLIHTYLRLADIRQARVTGFSGLRYHDHLGDKGERENEGEENVIDREVDREYQSYPIDRAVCVDCGDKKQFKISQSATIGGSAYPVDVVFWNAWVDKCKATVDLDDDAYNNYVCVEPGTIAKYASVLPGQKLSLVNSIKSGKK